MEFKLEQSLSHCIEAVAKREYEQVLSAYSLGGSKKMLSWQKSWNC
jgi:hypothetical protein